jgi:hypothetical protein
LHDRLRTLNDRDLLERLTQLAQRERTATAALVAHLAEVERRKLYRDRGYSSLFHYCVRVLRLSEATAYTRIHAARVALKFPAVLGKLQRGELHLSAITLLAPKLTRENHAELFAAAFGKSKRELQALLAERFPAANVPTVVRKLPERFVTGPAEPMPLLVLAAPAPSTPTRAAPSPLPLVHSPLASIEPDSALPGPHVSPASSLTHTRVPANPPCRPATTAR